MTTWQRLGAWVVAALPVLATAGCGQIEEQADAVAAVVRRLGAAVRAGDGAAACELLAPDTRSELEQSAGQTCAQAVGQQGLPGSGTVTTVDVYGQWARAVTSDDTLFLGAFGDGWRVVAAGCTSRGEDRPYDCTLQRG